MWLQKT